MKFKNYYKIMGISKKASQEEIKQAYHRLVHQFHPNISKEPQAEQKFKEINEAYEVLKDPQKRANYNANFKFASAETWIQTKTQAFKQIYTLQKTKWHERIKANIPKKNPPDQAKSKKTGIHFLERFKKKIKKPSQPEQAKKFQSIHLPNSFTNQAKKTGQFFKQQVEKGKKWPIYFSNFFKKPLSEKKQPTEKPKKSLHKPQVAPPQRQTNLLKYARKKEEQKPQPATPVKAKNYTQMSFFILVLVFMALAAYFGLQQFYHWQNHQQLVAGILKQDEKAIETLEVSDLETQKKVLENSPVKAALIDFYAQEFNQNIFQQLKIYHTTIEARLLNDESVYQILKNFYFKEIDFEMNFDNFKNAFQLLDQINQNYPYRPELSNKYEEIQIKKQQRLAELTQQYMACLDQALAPLLERTHCMVEARQQIERVGIEHDLPTDPNLPAMYTDEIQHALLNKDFKQAEKLLLDWEKVLPYPSKERDRLWQNLGLYRQLKTIITDLSGSDKKKIAKWLNQLSIDKTLQKEVFEIPKVQNNLVSYHLEQALILLETQEQSAKILPKIKVKLTQILTTTENPTTQTRLNERRTSTSTASRKEWVAHLLQECQAHYQAKRLTTGRQGTALSCYRKVLQKDPGNREALKGLKTLENRYKMWAKSALQRQQWGKVRGYIARIRKVNAKSPLITRLTQQLQKALKRQSQKPKPKPKPKPKRVPKKVTQKRTPPKENSSVLNQESPQRQPTTARPQPLATCEGCRCSDLLRQLSLGLKPLSPEQQQFFQTRCR